MGSDAAVQVWTLTDRLKLRPMLRETEFMGRLGAGAKARNR